jgi:hypothetical protein
MRLGFGARQRARWSAWPWSRWPRSGTRSGQGLGLLGYGYGYEYCTGPEYEYCAPTTTSTSTMKEGSKGFTIFVFEVSISDKPLDRVIVHFATADGSATGGSDCVPTSGTLT